MRVLRTSCLAALSLCILSSQSAGQEQDILDRQVRALKAITQTAIEICNEIKTQGHSSSVEASGNVKAKLSGVAKKLVDLGVEGSGKYTTQEHEITVLQQDLASAIKYNADCKKGVLELLQKSMLPTTQAPTPSRSHKQELTHRYQYVRALPPEDAVLAASFIVLGNQLSSSEIQSSKVIDLFEFNRALFNASLDRLKAKQLVNISGTLGFGDGTDFIISYKITNRGIRYIMDKQLVRY